MCVKSALCSQLFVALLLFCNNVMPTSGETKTQQQSTGQTSTASIQHQQHANHVSTQTQSSHQQQQHILNSAGVVAHPANGIGRNGNSILHDANRGHHNKETQSLSSTFSSSTKLPVPQHVAMQEILRHFNDDMSLNDPYQMFNEFKRETHDNTNQDQPPPPSFVTLNPSNMAFPYASLAFPAPPMPGIFPHSFNPFETYPTPFPITPRFFPIMSYPQPVYVPYPFIMSPDMFYPSYPNLPQTASGYEDSMSRGVGASRRPVPSQHSSSFPRNSPIYYVRLPPTPYMFLPGFGLGSSSAPLASYANILPYQQLPAVPSFSSLFNVPINFLANGKPTNIYQISATPNDIPNSLQFSNIPSSFNSRPPSPPPLPNGYQPTASSHYFATQSSAISPSINYASYPGSSIGSTPAGSSSATSPHQDSKLTALKRPYFFNGRPDDIYILPNSFNPLYSSENRYY